METMNILQYFNEHASKEDWEVVKKVYNRELAYCLAELGMQDKETFNLAELATIYTRVALERDLENVEDFDHEFGCCSCESTKDSYIIMMKEILKHYEEEEK